MDHLLAAGVHGLLANGTMGGFAFLRDEEQLRSIATTVETVALLRQRIPRFRGIEVSNQDCVNLQTLIELMRPDPQFTIFTGSEFLIVVALQMGCHAGLHRVTAIDHGSGLVHDGLRGGVLELRSNIDVRIGHQLDHHDADHLLLGVHPKERSVRAAPAVAAIGPQ